MKTYSSVINTGHYSTVEVATSSQIIYHNLDCSLDKNLTSGGEESLDWIMFGNNLGMWCDVLVNTNNTMTIQHSHNASQPTIPLLLQSDIPELLMNNIC